MRDAIPAAIAASPGEAQAATARQMSPRVRAELEALKGEVEALLAELGS